MSRTVHELRKRIESLKDQRDTIAEVLCEKARQAEFWRAKYFSEKQRAEAAEGYADEMLERELDEELDRLEGDEDFFACHECDGWNPTCVCRNRRFDARI